MYVRPLVDADLNKLSVGEQEALSNAIEKYASLSYDERQEGGKAQLKSHDVAWRSTARDFNCVNWDSIAREAGLDGEELAHCLCTAHQGQAGVVHGG